MAAFQKFNCFVEAVAEKVHNLGSDTLKIMLTNTAPAAGNTFITDITEISAGNGYSAGGLTVTVTSSAQVSGVYKLIANDVVLTATGAVGPFRYAVLCNSSAATKELIGWWDYGSAVTMANTETFTIDLDGTNGVLTLV